MALRYLLVLSFWYGFYVKKKKTAEKSTYHVGIRIGWYRIFIKEMRRHRLHITAEPSLHGERKILVRYKALLIKQYSMQKKLIILLHWSKTYGCIFSMLGVEGSLKVLYIRAQEGVMGGSYVWMILPLCTQMSNP
jgi:hypothetical protein